MCTLHANSAREAVVKMCILPLLAGENIGTAFVVPTVASSVDLVVHVGTEVPGHHRVREIVAVSPTFQVAYVPSSSGPAPAGPPFWRRSPGWGSCPMDPGPCPR
jgi:hypothetical protein